MGKFKRLVLTELGETTDTYSWNVSKTGTDEVEVYFKTENYSYQINFLKKGGRYIEIEFFPHYEDEDKAKDALHIPTNEGNQFKIVATVISAMKHIWRNRMDFFDRPERLKGFLFYSSPRRKKLYLQFLEKQFANAEIDEVRKGKIIVKPTK